MKNKILLVSIVFLFFSLCFINNSFAYTATEDIVCIEPTNTYLETAIAELQETYPEEDYYYVYGYSYAPRCYHLIFFEKQYLKINPYIIYNQYTYQGNDYYDIVISNDGTKVSGFAYKVFNNYYTFDRNNQYNDGVPAFTIPSNSTEPVEFTANFNVYNNSSCTDFFFKSPAVVEITPITLAGIMSKAGEQATAEMTKIILIVIMTTAGLTVLLIGLKKGLKVLMNGFRH